MQAILSYRIKPLITFTAYFLVIFFLFRIFLLIREHTYFADAGFIALSKALLLGLKFDIAIIVQLLFPFIIAFILPFRFVEKRVWRITWLALAVIPAAILILLATADLLYFSEVLRHIGVELYAILSDWRYLVESATGAYILESLFCLAMIILTSWLWFRIGVRRNNTPTITFSPAWQRWVLFVVGIPLVVLAGRGFVVDGKSINIVDAYSQGSEVQANLVISSAFSAFHVIRNLKTEYKNDLINVDVQALAEKHDIDITNIYTRQYDDDHSVHNNVVLIILESWGYDYIDALSGKQYGATPVMDEIVRKSLVFDNCYAAGQRSVEGLQAILTSVPVLPDEPRLSEGMEMLDMPRIGSMAKAEGYHPLFVQSSARRSFRMESLASRLGFEEFYGMEDIPMLRSYPGRKASFGWDYETLEFFEQKLNQVAEKKKPFFGVVYTGTTHHPFADPGADFHIRPHDLKSEDGFLNTLYYADWSLGQFFQSAAESEWFENTIFVITSDHVLRADDTDIKKRHRIPLIIYNPKNAEHVRSSKLTSQYDLLPTLADIFGHNQPFAAFGKSVFRENKRDKVLITNGNLVGFIADDKWLTHNLKETIAMSSYSQSSSPQIKELEEKLLLNVDVIKEKLYANCWDAYEPLASVRCAQIH